MRPCHASLILAPLQPGLFLVAADAGLALRDISVADPAGNDVHADQRWNLEVIAGFRVLRGRDIHPYRAHGTVTA